MARSLKKGPYVFDRLLKKVQELNNSGKKEVIKTCESGLWWSNSRFLAAAAAAAKSLQSCPTPCDPIDGSPPGSPVPGILQARTLEWVAISFSNA